MNRKQPDAETAANLMALLREVTKGSIRGNPYSNPVVKRALKHLAALRGIESHLDAADIETDKHMHYSDQNEQAVFAENLNSRLK